MNTRSRRPAERPARRIGNAAGWVTVLAALSACSSEAPAPPPQLNQSLGNTSWSGTCAGFEIGTYTFDFGPATPEGGTVKVGFPSSAQGPQTVRYTTPGGESGEQQLVMELSPPWNGSFDRDRENLRWDPRMGDTGAPAQCFLEESSPVSGR